MAKENTHQGHNPLGMERGIHCRDDLVISPPIVVSYRKRGISVGFYHSYAQLRLRLLNESRIGPTNS